MYQILILPLISGGLAQILKFFFRSNHLTPSFSALNSYSGMPSAHSATVVALTITAALQYGFNSPVFAISLIYAMLTIRDAIGLRQYLGQHGKVLNTLLKDLNDDKLLDNHYPHLLERIGHTPMQVLAGSILGAVVSVAGYLLMR